LEITYKNFNYKIFHLKLGESEEVSIVHQKEVKPCKNIMESNFRDSVHGVTCIQFNHRSNYSVLISIRNAALHFSDYKT